MHTEKGELVPHLQAWLVHNRVAVYEGAHTEDPGDRVALESATFGIIPDIQLQTAHIVHLQRRLAICDARKLIC